MLTMKFALLLLSLPLAAQPLVIPCGSATDQYFTGGTAYTDAGMGGVSLRFGPTVTYRIPLRPGLYDVRLAFMEPNRAAPAQRLQTVTIQGQASPQPLDVFALAGGIDKLVALPYVAVVNAGELDIAVTGLPVAGQNGNAVLSTITISGGPTGTLAILHFSNDVPLPGPCPAEMLGAFQVDVGGWVYLCSYGGAGNVPGMNGPVWWRFPAAMVSTWKGGQ